MSAWSFSSGSTLYPTIQEPQIEPERTTRVSFSEPEIIYIPRLYYPRHFHNEPTTTPTYDYRDDFISDEHEQEFRNIHDTYTDNDAKLESLLQKVSFNIDGKVHFPQKINYPEPNLSNINQIRRNQRLRFEMGLGPRDSKDLIYPMNRSY